MNLKGKKALVTGASSGLGVDFANILASKGVNLIIVARRKEKLEELKASLEEKYGIEARVVAMDIAGYEAANHLYSLTKNENIEILINNAGYGMYGYFVKQEICELNKMIQLDIVALTTLANLFAKEMSLKGSGYILNVASFASFNPTPLYAVYGAAKAFVMNFSVALREESQRSGSNIRVTALCPGFTATEFVKTAGQKSSWFLKKTIGESYPVALAGIEGLLRNRPVVTPRLVNKLAAFAMKFLTRKAAAEISFKSIK